MNHDGIFAKSKRPNPSLGDWAVCFLGQRNSAKGFGPFFGLASDSRQSGYYFSEAMIVMPKEFHIQINATFFANDILDAFLQLGNHFVAMSREEESTLDMLGDIRIHPTSDCQEAHAASAEEDNKI